jgi:hypothetical protein
MNDFGVLPACLKALASQPDDALSSALVRGAAALLRPRDVVFVSAFLRWRSERLRH